MCINPSLNFGNAGISPLQDDGPFVVQSHSNILDCSIDSTTGAKSTSVFQDYIADHTLHLQSPLNAPKLL
jgi:hypothetical protein